MISIRIAKIMITMILIKVDELRNLDSCEHIWERGVGFAQTPPQVTMIMIIMVMFMMMSIIIIMVEMILKSSRKIGRFPNAIANNNNNNEK